MTWTFEHPGQALLGFLAGIGFVALVVIIGFVIALFRGWRIHWYNIKGGYYYYNPRRPSSWKE